MSQILIFKNISKIMKEVVVSIGLSDNDLIKAAAYNLLGATKFSIDVRNPNTIECVRQTKALRKLIGKDKHITVGNFKSEIKLKQFINKLGIDYVDAIKFG